MEFFIKKNATLPLLKIQVVKDGRSDFNRMMSLIEESAIFFSMVDIETGIPKIVTRPAGFVSKKLLEPNADPEYYVYYQFQNKDTNKVGRYEGQFLLRNSDGVLILPIREKLFINVQESYIADDLPYDSCYISEFPCCVDVPFKTTTTTTTTPCPTCQPCPPITTTTTTSPVVTTTTTIPLEVVLDIEITTGSTIINYNLTSNQNVNEPVLIYFTHTLGVYSGNPITITTGVTIDLQDISGTTQVILDVDYNNLTRNDVFSNILFSPNYLTYSINEIYPITPTPTPTVTPTPTPTLPVVSLINPIITEDDDYIDVGENEYLMYVDPNIEYYISTEITSGSVVTTFTVTSNFGINYNVTIPLTVKLGLVGGGTIDVTTNVVMLSNQNVGQSIVSNPVISYELLDKNAELFVGDILPNNFPITILASQIQFE